MGRLRRRRRTRRLPVADRNGCPGSQKSDPPHQGTNIGGIRIEIQNNEVESAAIGAQGRFEGDLSPNPCRLDIATAGKADRIIGGPSFVELEDPLDVHASKIGPIKFGLRENPQKRGSKPAEETAENAYLDVKKSQIPGIFYC